MEENDITDTKHINNMYIRLQKGCKQINNKQHAIKTLLDMDIIYQGNHDPSEHSQIIKDWGIQPPCIKVDKKTSEMFMTCICSKQHIHNIALLKNSQNNKNYMIGSKCINVIHAISEMECHRELKNHIQDWKNAIQNILDNDKFKNCWGCMELNVRKNPKKPHSDPRRKHRCDDCIVNVNQVQCYECEDYVFHPKQIGIKKYKGRMRTTKNHDWFKVCVGCYKMLKNTEQYEIEIKKYKY